MAIPSDHMIAAPELTEPTTAARQGVTLGVMRWVLAVSLAGAVAGLVLARLLA